jgi:hypothetical protein
MRALFLLPNQPTSQNQVFQAFQIIYFQGLPQKSDFFPIGLHLLPKTSNQKSSAESRFFYGASEFSLTVCKAEIGHCCSMGHSNFNEREEA